MPRRLAAFLASLTLATATQLLLLAPVAAVDATGGLAITTVDPAGTLLDGTCFELYADTGGGTRGELITASKRCDRDVAPGEKPGSNDGFADGTTPWASLTPRTYVVHEASAPGLAGTVAAYETARDTTVSVTAGQVATLRLVHRPVAGLTIHIVDARGAALPGACITLRAPDGREMGICDGVREGTNSDNLPDGLLVLPGLAITGKSTTYVLAVVQAPAGYQAGATQTVIADPGKPTEITIRNTLGTIGGLAVTTVDPGGTILVGSCFELYMDAGGGTRGALATNGKHCDQLIRDRDTVNDGALDGTLAWTGLQPGAYVLHQTLGVALNGSPAIYEVLADTSVKVKAGAVSALTLHFRPLGGLTLHIVDAAGNPLAGACISLTAPDGRLEGRCDGPHGTIPSDSFADGLFVLPGLTGSGKPVTYTLREEVPPPGYAAPASQSVQVDPTRPTEITITNANGDNGGLAITTFDPAGTILFGACFELYSDAGGGVRGTLIAASQRCDQIRTSGEKGTVNDGLVDGIAPWAGLKPGDYVVHETVPPGQGGAVPVFELAADTHITVAAGNVAALRLVHRPIYGLTIHKVDAAGRALPGACFGIVGPDGSVIGRCDGPRPAGANPAGDGTADGLIVFTEVAGAGSKGGQFTLRELVAPPGYTLAADQPVSLGPKVPTELTIVDTIDVVSAPVATPAPAGPTEVVGLDLEISSTITISKFQTYAGKGTSVAQGTIPLTRDASGTWSGTGTLGSRTDVKGGECPSVTVAGVGQYDWQVRDVHAGPDIAAPDIRVGMDSGPESEAPDELTIDACSMQMPSTMNTWEFLWFNAYASKRQGFGFLVDGWQVIDANAWTAGGPVAEVAWTGECAQKALLGCTDATTFRLIVRVGPAAPGSSGGPAPGASIDPGATGATPVATQPSDGSPIGGLLIDCQDVMSCLSQNALLLLAVGGVVILGGGFLVLQLIRGGGTTAGLTSGDPVPGDVKFGSLDGSLQTDTLGKIEPDTLGKVEPGTLDADKFGTLDVSLQSDALGKIEPDTLGKHEPDTLGKHDPIDEGYSIGGTTYSPIDPTSGGLPPPPGTGG